MDFFTGLLKAFAVSAFSSKVMRAGLFHKASLLCVLALGFLMDFAQQYIDIGVSIPVGAAACVYIALMEVGSILENLCETNPELMPDKLVEVFGVHPRREASHEVRH
jgi:phage-related holin